MKPQFLVAAAHSGAGKTTLTLGLLRALRRRGHKVRPFKCGPDYIDPIHHSTAAGCAGINLDMHMMTAAHIRELYARYSAEADVCITEGVMGLFDGARKREGSTADLALLLDLPVILVINAKAMAYSAAAILAGLRNFDPRLRIAGVIFNFVDTPGHYRLLQEACADVGVQALGFLPVNEALRIPSRHLGLDTADADAAIDAAADHITRYINLDTLLSLTMSEYPFHVVQAAPTARHPARRILIARDAAFHFLYPENIRRLEEWGEVTWFSPLRDSHLPTADLLYLPGGYPEFHLHMLSGNHSLLTDIRRHSADGKRIIAECGGLMYLGESIIDEKGQPWPMAGLLPVTTSMKERRITLGYRIAEIGEHVLKGHEFHYSAPIGPNPTDAVVYGSSGQRVDTVFFYRPNILASYMHFYWGEDPGLIKNWITLW
jgi:cobyrinic acid a,c-diamide synthase